MVGYVALFSGTLQNRLNRAKLAGNSLILMYHRVIDPLEEQCRIEPGMYVTKTTFAQHLRFLKKYFNVVPLEKLATAQGVDETKKPFCALTFDDGWLDFKQNAFPLLMEYEVPATVFLPTGFIGTDDWFWTDRLANILSLTMDSVKQINIGNVSDTAKAILTLHGSYEKRLDVAIDILKALESAQINRIVNELSSVCNPHLRQKNRAFLSWEEVSTLARSGLVTFGSHTVQHNILTSLQSANVTEELERSHKDLLKHDGTVHPSFIPFCYPNGNHNDEIVELTRNAGYHLAVTTQFGWNHYSQDKFRLKRIGVHQDVSSNDGLFAFRIWMGR